MKNKLLIESIYLISILRNKRTVIVRVTANTRVLSNSDKDYKKKKNIAISELIKADAAYL